MRIMIVAATMILAIVPSFAKNSNPLAERCPKTTPEARGLLPVECPASWPHGKGASLTSAEFWDMDLTPGAPLCGTGKNEEIDIAGLVSPSDVGCTYANGAKLLISVPGTPVECWTADEKRFRTGHFNDGLVCYFRPTGDQSKDEIKITELEKLTRASELFGLHLGMTRTEVEQALNAQGARITVSSDDLIRATLSHGKEIAAVWARDGKAKEIDILAGRPQDNFYPALKRRFGIPKPGKLLSAVIRLGRSGPASTAWSCKPFPSNETPWTFSGSAWVAMRPNSAIAVSGLAGQTRWARINKAAATRIGAHHDQEPHPGRDNGAPGRGGRSLFIPLRGENPARVPFARRQIPRNTGGEQNTPRNRRLDS